MADCADWSLPNSGHTWTHEIGLQKTWLFSTTSPTSPSSCSHPTVPGKSPDMELHWWTRSAANAQLNSTTPRRIHRIPGTAGNSRRDIIKWCEDSSDFFNRKYKGLTKDGDDVWLIQWWLQQPVCRDVMVIFRGIHDQECDIWVGQKSGCTVVPQSCHFNGKQEKHHSFMGIGWGSIFKQIE